MVEFNDAIRIAQENVGNLIKGAKNFTLEEVVISSDNKLYEVTVSYDLDGSDSPNIQENAKSEIPLLAAMAAIMKKRREYKVFLVDKATGEFRGFRKYKD